MKKIVSIAMTVLLSIGMVFAGGASDENSEQAEYAVVLKVLSSQFWQTMKEGIEEKAVELGVTVDIYAANSEDDVEGQVALLENAISQGYKAIGVAPISGVNLNNAIADATSKGIYIVNIDEKINMESLVALGGTAYGYVATDNMAVGNLGASHIIAKLGGVGEVAIIEGKAGAVSGENRRAGAAQAFTAAGMEIVASQPADWDRTKAYDLTTNLITANPDLMAIYCCNDTMAMGAIEAVIASGRDILVVGTDGNDDAIASVKEGKLAATIAQDPAGVGARGLELMVEAVTKGAPIVITTEVPTSGIEAVLITQD